MSGIKDKTTTFKIERIPFKKIKGHTKIELTSVIDGSKQIIEHDNVFQPNVLADYIRSLGQIQNSPWRSSTWSERSIWQNLVGGILLFRDSIDNSGGEIAYMPAGNAMVGNGAYGVVNNGTPSELGSYNSLESAKGSNSVTIVYDWGTAQGNGTIGCICLTSRVGGRIGYGNPSGAYYSTAMQFDADQVYTLKGGIVYNGASYYFRVENDNHILKVKKFRAAVDTCSIFNEDLIEDIEIDYGSQISGRTSALGSTTPTSYVSVVDATHVLIQNVSSSGTNQSVADGSSYSALMYDLTNDTVSIVTYPNNSGRTIYPIDNGRKAFRVHKNRIFVNAGSSNEVCVLDATNGALITTIDIGYNNKPATGLLSDGLVLLPHYTTSSDSTYSSNYCYIYDVVANTCYMINASAQNVLPEYCYYYNFSGSARAVWNTTSSDASYYATYAFGFKNPLYLATINNLDAPVTKNNTQTMKVTYTLTEVEIE